MFLQWNAFAHETWIESSLKQSFEIMFITAVSMVVVVAIAVFMVVVMEIVVLWW
jgi:hypothetical protein